MSTVPGIPDVDIRPHFEDAEAMHGKVRACQCTDQITFDADVGRWIAQGKWVDGNTTPGYFSCTDRSGAEINRAHQPYDMVTLMRERGMSVCAEHCQGCGGFARVVCGDKSADNYWIRTFCKKCGFREGTWPK